MPLIRSFLRMENMYVELLCTYQYCFLRIQQHNKMGRTGYPSDRHNSVRWLYAENKSIREVASIMHVSRSTAHRWIHECVVEKETSDDDILSPDRIIDEKFTKISKILEFVDNEVQKNPFVTCKSKVPDLVFLVDPGRVNIVTMTVLWKGKPMMVSNGKGGQKPLIFTFIFSRDYTMTPVCS